MTWEKRIRKKTLSYIDAVKIQHNIKENMKEKNEQKYISDCKLLWKK